MPHTFVLLNNFKFEYVFLDEYLCDAEHKPDLVGCMIPLFFFSPLRQLHTNPWIHMVLSSQMGSMSAYMLHWKDMWMLQSFSLPLASTPSIISFLANKRSLVWSLQLEISMTQPSTPEDTNTQRATGNTSEQTQSSVHWPSPPDTTHRKLTFVLIVNWIYRTLQIILLYKHWNKVYVL